MTNFPDMQNSTIAAVTGMITSVVAGLGCGVSRFLTLSGGLSKISMVITFVGLATLFLALGIALRSQLRLNTLLSALFVGVTAGTVVPMLYLWVA